MTLTTMVSPMPPPPLAQTRYNIRTIAECGLVENVAGSLVFEGIGLKCLCFGQYVKSSIWTYLWEVCGDKGLQ